MTPPPDRRGPPPPPPKGGGVPSKLSESRRGPPPPQPQRPPSVGPGSARGPARPPADPEHPATQAPRPASQRPAPASHGHKKPPGKQPLLPKDDPKAGPKAFEIRRGRANPDAVTDEDGPMGPVVLPRSITQEAEEERLKERFGVDHLPEVQEVNSLVRMTESQGTLGPDRARRRLMIVVLLVLLVGGAAGYYAYKQGMLKGVLGGP